MELTFKLLNFKNTARCESVFHPINSWTPSDWGLALVGEVGEALNKIKKLKRLDESDKELDTEENRQKLNKEIVDELADTVIYADLLATRLGMSLEEAVIRKFNEVSDRRQSMIKF